MDTWQEWAYAPDDKSFDSFYNLQSDDIGDEENLNITDVSKYSVENEEEKPEKIDSKVISTALAKRRLQAYSNKLHLKKVSTRDDKDEDDKQDVKSPVKKTKKVLYPDERAKAVINEIEEIKKKEAESEWKNNEKTRVLVAAAIKTVSSMPQRRSRSSSPEKESRFKKRDIKSRNYRRTDSFGRKSTSPDRQNRKSNKANYPKNWTEYREQRLTVVKDTELKGKLLNLSTPNQSDLCLQLYNFNTPSSILQPFTFTTEDGSTKEIPLMVIRATKTKPHLIFSVNQANYKNGFINREQLFQMISTERKLLIEKLINSPSKINPSSKKSQTRQWYHKSWKKSAEAECKILENSVGLSFLQNYSDEEEDNDEEQIIICSSAKTNKKVNETKVKNDSNNKMVKPDQEEIQPAEKHVDKLNEKNKHVSARESKLIEMDKVVRAPSEENSKLEPGEIVEEKSGQYTPERKVEHVKASKHEFDKTKKTVEELVKRSPDVSENIEKGKRASKEGKIDDSIEEKSSKKEKKKRTKKKPKKKMESSEDEEVSSRIKKKKNKLKRKYSTPEEEDNSDEEEKKRKKNKKKFKSKKDKKKSKNKSENDLKNSKSKKKDDVSEEESSKIERKKKKKKDKEKKMNDDSDKSITENDSKKKRKKKKIKKSKENSFPDDREDQREMELEKVNKKKKKPASKNIENDAEDKSDRVKSKIVDFSSLENQERLKHGTNEGDDDEEGRKSKKRKKVLDDNEESKLKNKKLKKADHKKKECIVPSEISVRKESNKKSEDKQENKDEDKVKKKKKKSTNTKESPVIGNEKERKLHKKKKSYKEKEHSIIDDEFPLEKDTYEVISKDNDKDMKTPATEEYLEKWERDPMWETEKNLQPKQTKIFNSSWESDEEVFEQIVREPEKPRTYTENYDLEIPLNIKPFKRREVIDTDTELQRLKFESKCLSEERRQLEIEKIKVKELELQVMQEVQGVKSENKHNFKQNKTPDEKPKRYRWDKKVAEPKVSTPQKTINESVGVQKNKSKESGSSAVLENEYEEFMKALSSKTDKNMKTKDDCIDLTKLDESGKSDDSVVILPQDIPLIPMPNEVKPEVVETSQIKPANEIKPVPVPSPKVDIDKIPKPLINLSLSANITLDIASKVDSPNNSSINLIKPPLSFHLHNIVRNEDVVSSSNNETINYNLDISTSELSSQIPIIPNSNIVTSEKETRNESNDNISSSTSDIALTCLKDKRADLVEETQPFNFSGMILPNKKVLVNNSNVKLADSDDEDSTPKKHAEFPINKIPENIDTMTTEQEFAKIPLPTDSGQDKQTARPQTPLTKPRSTRRDNSPRRNKRDDSPRRNRRERSPRRKWSDSPRRDRSPSRRFSSPGRRSPPGRKSSPGRRRSSPVKRRQSSRRSRSPAYRRRSISPRKKSPPRSNSPRRSFSRRPYSKSPEKSKLSISSTYPSSEKSVNEPKNIKSPTTVTSPLERLKRSVADSTISDDLLPQPSSSVEEFGDSLVSQFYKNIVSSGNVSLDVGINQIINYNRDVKQKDTSFKGYYDQYSHIQQYITNITPASSYSSKRRSVDNEVQNYSSGDIVRPQKSFIQMSNMVQIVPTEIPIETEALLRKTEVSPQKTEDLPAIYEGKSQILQVGNMLQIVPADFPENVIKTEDLKVEPTEIKRVKEVKQEIVVQEKVEKQSAEDIMKMKIAERRAEREKRRLEKERKRKEKEKRREEKEKLRQIKMKEKTENMIKQALLLEVEGLADDDAEMSALNETPTQWPPLPIMPGVSKDISRSILIRGGMGRRDRSRLDKRKIVKFADGVKPGEGTSPSGGEDLSSPPPRIVLPKEKRYSKTKFHQKIPKKKVKVKIIKNPPEPESDEDDNLPPPSPPPGSPPPHIFPPRIKTPLPNNIHPYVTGIAGVQSVQSIQQAQNHQQIFRQQAVNLAMVPPPPPPHHHHGPPPPSHHGPPPPHHHGPPPPHHHGPPPPPHHHGPPPPHHHGPPHHHPPPPGPPYHRPPFHH